MRTLRHFTGQFDSGGAPIRTDGQLLIDSVRRFKGQAAAAASASPGNALCRKRLIQQTQIVGIDAELVSGLDPRLLSTCMGHLGAGVKNDGAGTKCLQILFLLV